MAKHWMLGSIGNFHRIWTSIAKKPYSFVIFQGMLVCVCGGGGGGGGGGTQTLCPPSGSAHAYL